MTSSADSARQRASGTELDRSGMATRPQSGILRARDIEAIVLTSLHGDPLVQRVLSSIRGTIERVVQRWIAIVRRSAELRR